MSAGQQLSAWARSSPNRLLALGVAVLIMALATKVGLKARGVAREMAARKAAWNLTASRLATVQQQFVVPTTTESSALIAESSQMGALGVPTDEKLTIVDMVGRLAEACALRSVRVSSVARSDSAFVPDRKVGASRINPADYALAVEFVGGFADAQKFVSSLPPSVSLSRMAATRHEGGGTQYQLILSVYQLDANSGH
jgi:hypothetical protein